MTDFGNPLSTAVNWALIEEPNKSLPGVARGKMTQGGKLLLRALAGHRPAQGGASLAQGYAQVCEGDLRVPENSHIG